MRREEEEAEGGGEGGGGVEGGGAGGKGGGTRREGAVEQWNGGVSIENFVFFCFFNCFFGFSAFGL